MLGENLFKRGSSYTILFIAILITDIFLNLYIIYYLNQLDTSGCQCAMGWQRKFILIYTYVSIALSSLALICIGLFPDYINDIVSRLLYIVLPALIIYIFASVFYTIVTIDYVTNLKNKECRCSDKPGRTVMLIISIVSIVVYTLNIIRFIAFTQGLFLLNLTNKKIM